MAAKYVFGGVAIIGITSYFVFSKSAGSNIGKNLADLTNSFTKGVLSGLGKPALKATEKAAVTVYNKALKPVGIATFNKVLKPGFKQIKEAPKVVAKKVVRATNSLNPLNIMGKGLKMGSNNIKKGFKKIFRI